ncbi:MAG: alpha/beta hydrolase [Rubrobacteraceae bacterium]|nr:alpha/beta hydrolase [Rubrobacteraceae bacterium]
MERSPWKSERVPGEVGISISRAGDGPAPVVCLHGITAQHRAFTSAARHVGPVRGLVGVDLRGRGDSDKPDSGYGLQAHAGDAIRVLDHLGLENATIAGHSMGAFVALKTALTYPDRVRALVLLDGGWPRVEAPPQEDMTEEQEREAQAIREGLARAFSRLDMVFKTPDDYLDFWFPDQNLTMADLPPDLADYYRYDLQEVEGGYNPKCSADAARQDSPDVTETSPTAEEMSAVGCPVALIRASEGFFPNSRPLIPDATRNAMAEALDIRSEMVLPGANHYTMLWPPYTQQWSGLLRDDGWWR